MSTAKDDREIDRQRIEREVKKDKERAERDRPKSEENQ